MFQLENFREIVCHDTKGNAKFKERLTHGLKNDIYKGFGWYLHSDQLLLSKAYKDLDEKVKKSYFSWQWEKTLGSKKTWEIGWTLMWAVENLKICTLIDYFCRKYIMFELKKTEELCHGK